MPLTKAERRLRGQLGAHTLHGLHDSVELTRNARAKSRATSLDYWLDQVPAEITDPAERQRRAEHLRSAYMKGLALKSARARRARAGGRGAIAS